MNDKVSDLIIDRAVELWCRKLREPVFDNGDDSVQGFISQGLASMVIENDKSKIDNIESSIEVFRRELTLELKRLRDSDEYFPRWLDTDYHPCKELAEAAKKAGIPSSQFSCKSSVNMYKNRVATSFGYGAEYIYHYQLSDGSWLITTLTGTDIEKVKVSALNGNPLGLDIEDAS